MIMLGEKGAGARAWHRATLAGLGAAALALTVGAGLFGRGAVGEARMLEGAGEAPPQDGRRVVTGGGGQRGEVRAENESAVKEIVEQSQESMVFFEPVPGAPAAVTEARMRMITGEQLRRANEGGADGGEDEAAPFLLTLPTVTVANLSAKTIREVGIGFETGGRVNVIAGYRTSMKPGESRIFSSDWRKRNVILPGTFGDVKVRVIWVAFDDGTHWGGRVPPPPPPPAPNAPDAPDAPDVPEAPARGASASTSGARGTSVDGSVSVVSLGSGSGGGSGSGAGQGTGGGEGAGTGSGEGSGVVRASGGGRGVGLGDRRVYAPEPVYPEIAKAARAEGSVSVKVTVDEDGNVVAASAVSGHPLLQSAAVDAARVSKFKPTLLQGKPVKVSGVISYVFALK